MACHDYFMAVKVYKDMPRKVPVMGPRYTLRKDVYKSVSFINPDYEKIHMNTEYILTKEQIRSINERYGGDLRTDAEIETALTMGKGKSIYRKIASLWRAILVGHPFTDGNKRTALTVALVMFEKCGIEIPGERKENMTSEIIRIAKENIGDIERIERSVRYAATGY